jgi:hypothetical protein
MRLPWVNPAYRDLDGQVRSQLGKLNRLRAYFGAILTSRIHLGVKERRQD